MQVLAAYMHFQMFFLSQMITIKGFLWLWYIYVIFLKLLIEQVSDSAHADLFYTDLEYL